MIRKRVSTIIALAAAAAPVFAQESDPVVVPVSQRLLSEEQRQMQVGQRLDVAQDKAKLIMKDLESNRLFKETGGDRMAKVRTVVGEVNKTHIPPAADHLRKARDEVPGRPNHLTGADKEISTIIVKLQDLLGQGQAQSQVDQLAAELKVIIRKQEVIKAATQEWGKQQLQNNADLEPLRREIARTQQDVAEKTREFAQKLNEHAKNESDPQAKEKLDKADAVVQEKKPQQDTQDAAEQVEQNKPVAAAQEQDQALAALKEVAKALDGGDEKMEENPANQALMDALQKLLDQQLALDQQVQAQADQLEQQGQQLAQDQAALQAALEQLMQQLDLAGLQAALQAMEAAQNALEAGQAPPEAAAAQALAQALAQAQAAQPAPPQPGPPGQAVAPAIPGVPGPKLAPPGPALDVTEGPRLFASGDKAGGDPAERSASRLNPLGKRERQALFENYVGELPPEYRGLLQDYYQVLSE